MTRFTKGSNCMRKTISGVLCALIIIVNCSVPAHASMESNAYIFSFGGQITAKGNGVVHVDFNTWGMDVLDTIGAKYIRIYEDGNWVKTFSCYNPLYTASMVRTNHWCFYGGVDYQGTAGKTYYAVIVHYGEKDGGSDIEVLQTGSTIAT